MNISGTLGFVLIKSNDQYYAIFYDDHNNKNYCDDKPQIFVDDYIDKNLNDDVCVFIEETMNNDKLKLLWNNVHVKKIQTYVNNMLKKNDKNVCFNVTDIRLDLVPMYFDEIKNNDIYKNTKVSVFFKKIIEFSNFINKHKNECVVNKHFFNKIQNTINKLIIPNLNLSMNDFLNKIDDHFELHDMIDNLMDYYTFCKIYESKKKINFIYYGLAHSLLYTDLLFKTKPNCKIIFSYGLNIKLKNGIVHVENKPIKSVIDDLDYLIFDNKKNCVTILGKRT